MSNDVRERLADVQHAIWAHWMRYQFSVCQPNGDGSVTIPADKVERWSRQMATNYVDLTEKERESDREQADKIISSIRHLLEGATLAEVYGRRMEADAHRGIFNERDVCALIQCYREKCAALAAADAVQADKEYKELELAEAQWARELIRADSSYP